MRARESLQRVADPATLARTACALLLAQARAALAERGHFHLALAGGATPRATYVELARAPADFTLWRLWFGDERRVAPTHEASNLHLAAASGLLARVPPAHVHRLRGEAADGPAEARRYAAELEANLGTPPRFDLVLLGLGADGHTASLFPESPALEERAWVTSTRAPVAPFERLSLTLACLNEARAVLFLVAGAEKRAALQAALTGSPPEVPAHRVLPRDGELTWLVDQAAAPALPGG